MKSWLTASLSLPSGSQTLLPLISAYTTPCDQVATSGRLSTVKRATKSPPELPSPDGNCGTPSG